MRTLTLACWGYDRVRALEDGRVKVEGVELKLTKLWVQETFRRMLSKREFEASEMSLSAYVSSIFTPERPFVGLPVFLSRKFRLGYIFVNSEAGIRRPADLRGRRIGIPEFRHTASIWIRGIMEEKYGLPVGSPTYYVGRMEREGSARFYTYVPELDSTELFRSDVRVVRIPEGETLAEMLARGEVDAIYHAQVPSTYYTTGRVKRLFENYVEEDLKYFKEEGIFPIMHLLVLRRDVYEGDRKLTRSLYDAFLQAKEIAYEELRATGANVFMHPWLDYEVERVTKLMGRDFWPYGVKANRRTLEKFLLYMHSQGLIPERPNVEDLFAPEVVDT
jgi:4,5-dihydroxyphthalate decarboxylase